MQPPRGRKPHNLPEPAANPVSLNRGAHLLGHREADPRRSGVLAFARLQQEGLRGGPRPGGGGEKVRPLSQALHGSCARPTSAPSRAEPLTAARAASVDDLAAAFRGHAGAKPVPALAHQFARLISPLHGSRLRFLCSSVRADCPRLGGIGQISSVADCAPGKFPRLIREGPVRVNASGSRRVAGAACIARHHAPAMEGRGAPQIPVRWRRLADAALHSAAIQRIPDRAASLAPRPERTPPSAMIAPSAAWQGSRRSRWS